MNIEQVNEALARLDRTKAANLYRPDIEPVIDAARRFVAGWETCPTCGGSSPDCVDGIIPGPALVERCAMVLHDNDGAYAPPYWSDCTCGMKSWYRTQSKAVLLASRREEQ